MSRSCLGHSIQLYESCSSHVSSLLVKARHSSGASKPLLRVVCGQDYILSYRLRFIVAEMMIPSSATGYGCVKAVGCIALHLLLSWGARSDLKRCARVFKFEKQPPCIKSLDHGSDRQQDWISDIFFLQNIKGCGVANLPTFRGLSNRDDRVSLFLLVQNTPHMKGLTARKVRSCRRFSKPGIDPIQAT